MIRKANAVWRGGLKDGKGQVSTGSGVLKDVPYNFSQRFEDAPGTNPEELIGAAHAGCYSMALSHMLTEAGHKPERLHTKAHVSFDKVGDGFGITGIKLVVDAKVPGMSADEFKKHAEKAKTDCPVSKALSATPITLEATLAS